MSLYTLIIVTFIVFMAINVIIGLRGRKRQYDEGLPHGIRTVRHLVYYRIGGRRQHWLRRRDWYDAVCGKAGCCRRMVCDCMRPCLHRLCAYHVSFRLSQ